MNNKTCYSYLVLLTKTQVIKKSLLSIKVLLSTENRKNDVINIKVLAST